VGRKAVVNYTAKSISIDFIALMNRDYAKAQLKQRRLVGQSFP
jgi:hypothetical protein